MEKHVVLEIAGHVQKLLSEQPLSVFVGLPLPAGINSSVANSSFENAGAQIAAVDPGHGGKDPGAIGSAGEMEKHVVLEIAGHVQKLLRVCRSASAGRNKFKRSELFF
jgi:N-acetylmuramoyl-L-alanine amidase